MLSQESLDELRRMTPGQRLEMALRMTEEQFVFMVEGDEEVVARRFEMLRRENDQRTRNMLTAIARTRRTP